MNPYQVMFRFRLNDTPSNVWTINTFHPRFAVWEDAQNYIDAITGPHPDNVFEYSILRDARPNIS